MQKATLFNTVIDQNCKLMEKLLNTTFNNLEIGFVAQGNSAKRILLIEDDEALIEVLGIIFTNAGFTYKAYTCVENILPLIEDFRPDLVLLDYSLPVLNGEILCNQIKRCKQTTNLPVIIFSGHNDMFLSVGKYGCDAFVGKPFKPDYLVRKIEHYLNVLR